MEDGDKRDKRKVILRGMEARKSILILISGAGGKAKGTGAAGAGLAGDGFLPLLPISNFIYEMVKNPGENCQGWQF